MKRKSSFTLVLILAMFLLYKFPKAHCDIENLWCNEYISNRLGWTKTGVSPYLDDTDGSYIYTNIDAQTEGDFSFSDLSSAGSIISVTLYVECYANDAPNDDGFYVNVWDGISWSQEGLIQPSTTGWGTYETLSLTSKFNTYNKINDAQIYVEFEKSKAADFVYIRRAYLNVDYTPTQSEEFKINVTQSINWSGSNYRILNLERYFSQSLTISNQAYRKCDLSKFLTQIITIATSTSRNLNIVRTFTKEINFASNVIADIAKLFKRIVKLDLSFISNIFRSWFLTRIQSKEIITSFNVKRCWVLLRTFSQTITTNFYQKRVWFISRIFTQSISTNLNLEKLCTFSKKLTQIITLNFNTKRIWNLNRIIYQSISFTFNTLSEITRLIKRTVNLVLSFNSNSFRNWSLTRILSKSINTGFNVNRVWNLSRKISQVITTNFNSERLVVFIRKVSQSISFSWQTFAKFTKYVAKEYYRTVSMSITTSFNSIRNWILTRNLTQSISFNWNSFGQWMKGTIWKTLNIIVKNLSGEPIENALVTCWKINGTTEFAELTDPTGHISTKNMTIGNYTLFTNKEKYLTNSSVLYLVQDKLMEIILMSVEEAEMIEFNIPLLMIYITTLALTGLFILKGRDPGWGALTVASWFTSAFLTIKDNPNNYMMGYFYVILAIIFSVMTFVEVAKRLAPKDTYWEEW